MAVSVRIKRHILGLLVLALILRQTPLDSGGAVESTLIIQPSVGDTYVNSMYLHTQYSEDPHGYLWAIFAGNMYVEYDSYKLYGNSRIYIKFNITSIPQDAKILSANMCLYMYDPPKSSQEFEVYRVLSDWDQYQTIWRTQPFSAGASTATVTINPTPKETWVCWDITNDLKIWHSKAARNYGTMIKIKHEMNASDQVASFYPREGSQPQRLKPKLLVNVDWHREITPTPTPTSSQTPSPIETQTYTHSPNSSAGTIPTAPDRTSTQTPQKKPEQNPVLPIMAVILMVTAIAGGAILTLRKNLRSNVHSKKIGVARRHKGGSKGK
jgi:hypothetical protein